MINRLVIRYFVQHNYTEAWTQINESFFKNLMGGDYCLVGDDRMLSPASNLWSLSYIIFLLNKNYYSRYVEKVVLLLIEISIYIFETIKMQTWEIWKKGIRIFYEGVFCCLLFGELLGLQLNKLSIAR